MRFNIFDLKERWKNRGSFHIELVTNVEGKVMPTTPKPKPPPAPEH